MKCWRVCLAVALAATGAIAQTPACAQRAAFISIVAKDGAPILDATAADVQLRAPSNATIASWGARETTPKVALLLDASGSMFRARQAETRVALAIAIAAPPNALALVTFNDHAQLEEKFRRTHVEFENSLAQVIWGGGTALYDAVSRTAGWLRGVSPEGYIAEIVLSDGKDDSSLHTAQQAATTVAAEGAAVFLVVPPGIAPSSLSGPNADAMKHLVSQSGGTELRPHRRKFQAAVLWSRITQGYILTLRLGRPRLQPVKWKLRLAKAFRHAHHGARIFYPHPLPACAASGN